MFFDRERKCPFMGEVLALSHIAEARMEAAHSSIKGRWERIPEHGVGGFIASAELTSKAGYFVAWHGRLDNKTSLLTLLDQRPEQHITNSELILQLYVKYGESFFSRLLETTLFQYGSARMLRHF